MSRFLPSFVIGIVLEEETETEYNLPLTRPVTASGLLPFFTFTCLTSFPVA